jgi:toxin YoeB
MGKYSIKITKNAQKDLEKILKSGDNAAIVKVQKIVEELKETPKLGIGNPEELKGNLLGYWSRRINKKDRIICEIDENEVSIMIISALGHYSDK